MVVRQDAQLVDTVKKVELAVGRLRMRPSCKETPSSTGAPSFVDPSLTLVEKARMLKSRASRLARRVQVDKSDETASTFESLTRPGGTISPGVSRVTWYSYKEALGSEDYGEI